MGDTPNLPKPSTQLLSSLSPPPPPQPPSPHRSNMPMLYYGLVVVATAAIVLAVYNLIVVRWCATQYRRSREDPNHLSRHPRAANIMPPSSTLSRGSSSIGLTSSFRYKKGTEDSNKPQLDYDMECSVCLSVFEDGEEVRKLPICSHSFHASCIDMWLNSHYDCPLCRAPVVAPPQTLLAPPPQEHRHTESEHSRDGLLEIERAGSSST